MLTPDRAREHFIYYPEHGELYWRKNKGTARCGHRAGATTERGRKQIMIDGERYYSHRICWLIFYGEHPEGEIDHINGDPTDNRINNLRVVSRVENLRNMKQYETNTSGVTGVSKQGSRWKAYIHVEGKQKYLGLFEYFDDAVNARGAAEMHYGFHPNHGRS